MSNVAVGFGPSTGMNLGAGGSEKGSSPSGSSSKRPTDPRALVGLEVSVEVAEGSVRKLSTSAVRTGAV